MLMPVLFTVILIAAIGGACVLIYKFKWARWTAAVLFILVIVAGVVLYNQRLEYQALERERQAREAAEWHLVPLESVELANAEVEPLSDYARFNGRVINRDPQHQLKAVRVNLRVRDCKYEQLQAEKYTECLIVLDTTVPIVVNVPPGQARDFSELVRIGATVVQGQAIIETEVDAVRAWHP